MEIKKFNSKVIRTDVVRQMEAMQQSKFAKLPEDFKESVYFAVEEMTNLDGIERVEITSITKALISMFSNKLDARKKHCYFFVQNDRNSPTGKSLRFGWQYQGLIHVAKTQCNVKNVLPVLIGDGDEFNAHYENGHLIVSKHIPKLSDTTIKGGYCVVEFTDGSIITKHYTKQELDRRKDKSMQKSGSFWNTWSREMYEKTLVNATVKRIIETSSNVNFDDSFYEEPEETEHRAVEDAEIIHQEDPQTEDVREIQMFQMT